MVSYLQTAHVLNYKPEIGFGILSVTPKNIGISSDSFRVPEKTSDGKIILTEGKVPLLDTSEVVLVQYMMESFGELLYTCKWWLRDDLKKVLGYKENAKRMFRVATKAGTILSGDTELGLSLWCLRLNFPFIEGIPDQIEGEKLIIQQRIKRGYLERWVDIRDPR